MDPRKRIVEIITEGLAHVAATHVINQTARLLQPGGQPPAMRAFVVEVRTEAGQFVRYDAISTSSCAALIAALDTWGFAKISISPRSAAQ